MLPGGKCTPLDQCRTAATTMAEFSDLPNVVEKCLNHAEVAEVKRIYQPAQYEGPMRETWKLLGTHLARLQNLTERQESNVKPTQLLR